MHVLPSHLLNASYVFGCDAYWLNHMLIFENFVVTFWQLEMPVSQTCSQDVCRNFIKLFPCRDFFSHDPFGDDIFKEFFGGMLPCLSLSCLLLIVRLCLFILTDVFAAFISFIVSILREERKSQQFKSFFKFLY